MNNIELFNHNIETYNNIMNLWNNGNDKVAVVQATGTGKSYLIGKITEDFSDKRILILAPRTHILNGIKQLVNPSIHCIYITYSKLNFMSKEDMEELRVDLIIMDEFHRCGSNAWGTSVNKLLEIYKGIKVLGTTATNIRYLDNHRDMATEIFNDCIACKTDLSDAINQSILPMPVYVTALYSIDEEVEKLQKKIKTNDINEYQSITDKLEGLKKWNTTIGVPNILKKYINKNNNKFIVFCKNKNHLDMSMKTVVEWFKHADIKENIKTYSLTYKNGKSYNTVINEFKSGDANSIHLLFSIDILNEGFHLDSVGVILLRETVSPTLFFQQIGRALTVSNSTKPLIFDFVNNFNALKGYAFKNSLIQSRNKLSERNTNLKKIDFTIYDESKSFRDILSTISDTILDSWDIRFKELEEYFAVNGHCIISRKDNDLSTLYRWCAKQRALYKNGLLSEYQIDKLKSLNFAWDLIEERWLLNYINLVKHYEIFGNTKVSYSYSKSLNAWCANQRLNRDKLSIEQIELLNEINFQWNVLEEEFQEKLNELKEYKATHGNLNIPRRYPDNPQLANWLYRLRGLYKKGTLSQDRIDILNELGFIWDIDEYRWELRFKELSKYYSETQDYSNKGIPLSQKTLKDWISRQRVAYRQDKLSQDKLEKLKSINFIFEVQ